MNFRHLGFKIAIVFTLVPTGWVVASTQNGLGASLWVGSFTARDFEGYPDGMLTVEFTGDPGDDFLIRDSEFTTFSSTSSGFGNELDIQLSFSPFGFGESTNPFLGAVFDTQTPTFWDGRIEFFNWDGLQPSGNFVYHATNGFENPAGFQILLSSPDGTSSIRTSSQPAIGKAVQVPFDI